jgi:hypothetical protein
VSEADPHSPTSAGPAPAGDVTGPEPPEAAAQAPAPELPREAPEPTPTVGSADATFARPAGSAMLGAQPVDPHPEKLVGAAFAGGLVAALVLKGLARRKHA